MVRLALLFLIAVLSQASSTEDASIAARLKAKLSRSKLRTDSLQYQVKDGVVEWSGSVRIPQRKGAATRMAKSAGAKRVVNRIAVQTTSDSGQQKPTPRRASVYLPKP